MPARALRQDRVEARVTPEQKRVLVEAAELRGQTLTDFVISHAVDAAQRVLYQRDVIELTARDQLALAQMLLNPPEPNARLVEAARLYREQFRRNV